MTAVDRLFLAFQQALAGRYSIDRELGRGGMGVVFLAREVHLDRMVAIKVLPPEKGLESALRERFLREARLAAKLSHPNIIPIHSVEELGEFVFFVMAFIDGETLANRVRTRGPLPSGEGARVLREVAWALSHAHSHGVVHRDVKPDNIMLEAGSGRVLVADFGIAAVTHEITGAGVAGTPEFMSPEQVMGQDVDGRSDVYALGVTAFYMYTGRLPFEGKSATEVLAKQVTEAPPSLGAMGVPVSRKLVGIIDRCIAKSPDRRHASADALAEQLGVALEQRRELPAALRAFVKRGSRLNGAGTMLGGPLILGASVLASAIVNLPTGFATFALGMFGLPMSYLVNAAHKLLKQGFAHADIGPAFITEIEQDREERVAEQRQGRPTLEMALRGGIQLSLFAAAASLVGIIGGFAPRELLFTVLPMSIGVAFMSTVGLVATIDQRRDVDIAFWSRVWNGAIGKGAFSIARKFLGRGARASAVTHRATELSLGMAAESLYESLPADTRKSLGNLTGVVRRLQDDAQKLRKLYEELQDALASVGDAPISEAHRYLRTQRDDVHAKLGTAVGALETIRLNLLKLHAGSGNIRGLTTHVDLAAEVSAEVERMLAAREEVDRALFPRRVAATPA